MTVFSCLGGKGFHFFENCGKIEVRLSEKNASECLHTRFAVTWENDMKMTVSDPIVVAQGPTYEEVSWGPWQFPTLGVLDDGRIVCGLDTTQDDMEAYGVPKRWFVSADGGDTWGPIAWEEAEAQSAPVIPSGDRLLSVAAPPVTVDERIFPKEEPKLRIEGFADIYEYDDLGDGAPDKVWFFHRVKKGEKKPIEEATRIAYWPHMPAERTARDKMLLPFGFGRLRVAPDGSLWQMHYTNGADPKTGEWYLYHSLYYFRSTDNGRSWSLASYISAKDVPDVISFCEQDIAWTKSGAAVSLIRAFRDGENVTYIAHSGDGGFHWDSLEEFDDVGVDPAIRVLDCGAGIASYGRPGFYIRASFDPDLKKWEEPYEVISRRDHSGDMNYPCDPGPGHSDGTCAYSEILPTGYDTALVTYVDFFVPDENGVKRKSLMVRKIKFEA